MTGVEIATYIRFKTRTNSQTFTDAELINLFNVYLAELSKDLMGTDEDTLVTPMHTSLIAGLREYPMPTSLLARIKYVEAKLDGTTFIHLNEFDLNQYDRPTNETDILARFSNEKDRAFYDINRGSLVIYSGAITDVEAGLKLWCNTYPAKMNASRLSDASTDLSIDPDTVSHGFPRELHLLWATLVIIDYKSSRQKPIPLTESEMAIQRSRETTLIAMKHGNADRYTQAEMPPPSDRGNSGYAY